MLQLQLAGRGAPPATSLTILPVEVGTGPPGGPPSSLMVCLSGSFGSRGHPGRVQRPPDSQVSCQRPSSGGAKSQPDHAFLLGAVLCFPVQVHHLMAGCHVPRVQGTPVIVVAVQSRGWCRLLKGTAARGRGLQSHTFAAGSLLEVAGAGIDDAVGATYRVPAGGAVARAAAARDLRPLLRDGSGTCLARGPAWRARRNGQAPGTPPPNLIPASTWAWGWGEVPGVRTTLHSVETVPRKP